MHWYSLESQSLLFFKLLMVEILSSSSDGMKIFDKLPKNLIDDKLFMENKTKAS